MKPNDGPTVSLIKLSVMFVMVNCPQKRFVQPHERSKRRKAKEFQLLELEMFMYIYNS